MKKNNELDVRTEFSEYLLCNIDKSKLVSSILNKNGVIEDISFNGLFIRVELNSMYWFSILNAKKDVIFSRSLAIADRTNSEDLDPDGVFFSFEQVCYIARSLKASFCEI